MLLLPAIRLLALPAMRLVCVHQKRKTAHGQPLTQDAAVAEEQVYLYSPIQKALAFNDGEIADGTEIVVFYMRQIQADVLENMSDKYSGLKCALYIDALLRTSAQTYTVFSSTFRKADFNGEVQL